MDNTLEIAYPPQPSITNAIEEHFSRSVEVLPNDFERKHLDINASFMISNLNHPVHEYIKEYTRIDESKIYVPPYDITLTIPNKFLQKESKEMITSIFYLYAFGSEGSNKVARDLTERYSTVDDSSDQMRSL